MTISIIIAILTCVTLILSVLFFPKIKIFNKQINTYVVVCLAGALLMVLFKNITFNKIFDGLTTSSSINPLKILVLFISMTFLSIYLDEVGFFKYLACVATKKSKANQKILFLILYMLVSVLTIFTSNDIVILTFTPFICYFAKNTKINPIPYLVAEFAAANTWSMLLMIGNPTNIYLSLSSGIDFISYFKVMFLPTIFAGLKFTATIAGYDYDTTIEFEFADTPVLKGALEVAEGWSFDNYYFTAVLEDKVLTMTTADGKVMKATMADGKMTIDSDAMTSYNLVGETCTCSEFKLPVPIQNVFSGKEFTGSYDWMDWDSQMEGTANATVKFDKGEELKGSISSNECYSGFYYTFTATLEGNVITMDCGTDGIVKATITGETMKITAAPNGTSLKGATLTCPGFALPAPKIELAGKTFEGNCFDQYDPYTTAKAKIIFDAGEELKGKITLNNPAGMGSEEVTFTAVLDGTNLVITAGSKTIKATVDGNNIKLSGTTVFSEFSIGIDGTFTAK